MSGAVVQESLQTLTPGAVKTIKLQEQSVGLSSDGKVTFGEGILARKDGLESAGEKMKIVKNFKK